MNDPHSWYPFSAFKFFLIIFRIHFTKELSAIIMIKNELGGRPVRLKVNWCQKSAKALCRKHYGVHLFCQRDTRKTSGIATIPEVFWCLSIVVFHALRTLPFYLVSHMAVDIQCERRRGVAEVALHCLDAIAGADSCDGI